MSDQFDPYHVWLGIPPEEQPPNHYRLLGLRSLESDPDVISNALDQRLAFLRTFQAGKRAALSQKLLNEVSAAGVVLLHRERKEQYDRALRGPSPPPPLPVAKPLGQPKPLAQSTPPMVPPPPAGPEIGLAPAASWASGPSNSAPYFAAPPATSASSEHAPATFIPDTSARGFVAPRSVEPAANPHLMPLIASGVGLLGLLALVLGGWWLLGGSQTTEPDRPVVVDKGQGGKGKTSDMRGGSDTIEPATGESIDTPVSVVTASDRQIWLADGPTTRVFRRVGGHWVDYHDRGEAWYQPGPASGRSVQLLDPVRRVVIELHDDRAEVYHPTQSAHAVACTGRWISAAELPAFAKRPPATKMPDPLRWQSTSWHALVFDGHSSVSLPIPPEITRPHADFTIEMWVRFASKSPESRLLLAGPLELHTLRPRLEVGGPPSMLMADIKSGPLGIPVRPPVLGDKWHHWAVVRAGKQLKLFIDGQSRAALPLDDSFAIRAPSLLLGGRGFQQPPNLHGLIREVRISRGARYSQSFRPPLRLAKDEQTLVLPKFQAGMGDLLDDLSGRGHHGSRGTAQWLPLTMDEGLVQAEQPPDFVDLERTFVGSVHTLRGHTQGNPAEYETSDDQGVSQMLIPYQPVGDFDLDLEITRLDGEGGLLFGLVLGPDARQVSLAVNAFADHEGPYTGILPTELDRVRARQCLVKHESKFVTGQKQRIIARVRNPASNRYSLHVTIDGATVCDINDVLGNSALGLGLKMPQRKSLFWGSHNAKIRYHSMRLYPPGNAKSQFTDPSSSGQENPAVATKGNPATTSGVALPSVAATSSPPSAAAAVAGKAWLADGPEKLAIRLSGGRWIELREREEYWYNLRDASPREYLLSDAVRKLELRLRDSEVAVRTPKQEWASLGSGRWVAVAELPAFAQRPRGRAPSDSTVFREPEWHALMFDGKSALRMALPSEIAPEKRDFTVEAWLRFDTWRQPNLVRLMNAGSLAVVVAPAPSSANPDARELHLIVERVVHRIPVVLATERWTHWALVREGNQLRLFVDGQAISTLMVSDRFTLDGAAQSVVFGQFGGSTSSGFTGLLRDYRVSKVARYSGQFTPPLRFEADSEALVLPKFLADPQAVVRDLSTSNTRITRDKAQWVTLNDLGELAGNRPDGSIDLTRLYSVSNHTLAGQFNRTLDHTDTLTPSGPAHVLVPYQPPANYDVELEATRLEGEGGLLLGLVVGDKQSVLAIDALPQQGRRTGLLPPVALSNVVNGQRLTSHAPLLVTGKRHRFVVKVRQQASTMYSVQVACDGNEPYASFQGNPAELGVPSELASRLATAMSLGSLDAKVRFHSLLLRPVDALGSGAPLAVSSGSTGGTITVPAATEKPPVVSASRLPVPSAEELARRLAEARRIFEVQLKEAIKPAQKASLAQIVLAAADNTKSDSTARYVLIDLARKVFIQAGEVAKSLATARTLEKEFEVAQDEIYAATIEALDEVTLPPEERTALAKTAIDLADELLAAEEFEQAEKMSVIAAQSANKQKDADLRKDIVQRRGQIVRVATAAQTAQPSVNLLTTMPEDRAAHLAVGTFRCFVLEDWEAGLPHLVKSADPLFAAPAALDLATKSGKPFDLAAAGEAWLKLASEIKTIARDDRPALQRRGRMHLTSAAPGLIGLERVRVEKRLEEVKDVGAAAPKRPAKTRIPRAAVLSGLIGRVSVRGQDAGIVVTYQPGYTITPEDVQKLQAAAGVTVGDSWRVDLLGVLSLSADSQLELRHVGGSASGGVHTLFIGTQSVSEIGDDRSKDDTRQVSLRSGQHAIRWTLTGGDLGTAQMSLVPIDAAGKPKEGVAAIQYSRDMNIVAHSSPYKHEFKWGVE